MTRREVVGRYRGSALGILWSFIIPILMLTVYTFVFSFVFKARWGEETGTKSEFALFLFVGLIVYTLFAECVNRAPNLILSNANYVKKVVFPLEILPWVAMGSALFHAVLSLAVLLAWYAFDHGTLHWTTLFLPITLFPLIMFTMGVSWMLASVGVFVRDIGQSVNVLTTILLFLSPIFYPASTLPKEMRPFLFLNPLTFMIEQARDVIIFGNPPAWVRLEIYLLVSFMICWLGFFCFQKMRKGFADVI